MDRLTRAVLAAGVAILMAAIVLVAGELAEGEVVPLMVAVASALLFVAIARAYLTRKGEVYADERTLKIHNSALAISWWAAYVVMAAAYLLSRSGALRLALEDFIPLMFFVMLASYGVAKVYLSRRRL